MEDFTNTCYFQFGYWPEISHNLLNAAKDKTLEQARYPLVMLSAGWIERKDFDHQIYSEINDLEIYIIQKNTKNLTTVEREEQVFQGILNTLYNELIEGIKTNQYIYTGYLFPHTKQNLYYTRTYGTEQNQLIDYIDVMALRFDSLKIQYKYTCQ